MTAEGRNCKFAAAPDSGDSVRMYRTGRSVDGRVRQLDPFEPVTPVETVARSWTSRAVVSGQPGDTTITSTRLVGRLPVQVPKHPADAGADRSIAFPCGHFTGAARLQRALNHGGPHGVLAGRLRRRYAPRIAPQDSLGEPFLAHAADALQEIGCRGAAPCVNTVAPGAVRLEKGSAVSQDGLFVNRPLV